MPVVLLMMLAIDDLKPIMLKIIKRWFYLRTLPVFGRRKAKELLKIEIKTGFNQPKPNWVKHEVMRIKAFMPHDGCRAIANVFNRLQTNKKQMTVSKTYVHNIIRKHQYEIKILRNQGVRSFHTTNHFLTLVVKVLPSQKYI